MRISRGSASGSCSRRKPLDSCGRWRDGNPFRLSDGRRARQGRPACAACSTPSRRSYDLMNDLMSGGLHRAWKAYAVAVASAARRATACSTSPAAPATSRAPSRRPRRRRRAASCTPTSTRRCCASAATACSTKAWSLPTRALRRRDAAVRRRRVRPRQRRLRPAQHDAQGPGAGRDGARAASPAAGCWCSSSRRSPRRCARPTTGIRSTCCRGSASSSPATPTATATSPNRSACIPTRQTLKAMMKAAGFGHVDVHNMTAGVVALHVGIKC